MMKKLAVLTSLLTTTCVAVYGAHAIDKAKVKNAFSSSEIFLFQHADQGEIKQKGRCYEISMQEPGKVTYFSQAPNQITGKLTTKEYMETWKHNKLKKPNAILHGKLGKKQQDISYVFAISKPKYNAEKHTISYTACPFRQMKSIKTGRVNNINLFLDPFHRWPP